MKRMSLALMALAVASLAACGGRKGASSSSSDPSNPDEFSVPVTPDAGVQYADAGGALPDASYGNGSDAGTDDGTDSQDGKTNVTLKMQGFDDRFLWSVPLCIKDVKVFADHDCLETRLLQTNIDIAQCTQWRIAKFELPDQVDKVKIKIAFDPECGMAQDDVQWAIDMKGKPIEFYWDADELRKNRHLTVHVDVAKSFPPDTTSLLFLPNIIVRSGALHQPNGDNCEAPPPPPPPAD